MKSPSARTFCADELLLRRDASRGRATTSHARRVGIGWRPELATDLLVRASAADLVEVTAEACTASGALREARAVAEAWPVVVHGVKASLGSADGLDRARTERLGLVARELRASVVSEHVSFVRAGGVEIGHLTGVPFTGDAVQVLARNVGTARRLLPDVQLLLENVAWSFRWPQDAIEEGAFHREVCERTGCGLLLDVGNLYANARNAGRDPAELMACYPLDRVAMLHVAGGVDDDGFYLDTHAHAVPDAVFDLVARVLAATGDVPIVLERDASFPAFGVLEGELQRLRELPCGEQRRTMKVRPPTPRALGPLDTHGLLDAQVRIARLLTWPELSSEDSGLVRARGILRRKRADDALPLLPMLARHGERAYELALRCLEGAPRPPERVAVADALRVAQAAERDPTLGPAARVDAALLRARFVARDGFVLPRVAPFFERVTGPDAMVRWIIKGLGADARVRVVERTGEP